MLNRPPVIGSADDVKRIGPFHDRDRHVYSAGMRTFHAGLVVMVALMAWAPPVSAQRGRACVGPQSIVAQPILVIPEGAFFSYRFQVFNAGAVRRNFSYHFPLNEFMPTPGAIYAFDIRPQQTIIVHLGTSLRRASDETLRNTLRITCHS